MKKRLMSLLLVVAFMFPMISTCIVEASANASTVSSSANSIPMLSIEEGWANPGETVEVDLVITNNPGILGATLTVSWDEGLSLVADASGEAFSELTYASPSRYIMSGTNFVWYGNEVDKIADGTVLTLSFRVSEDAENNETYGVYITYDEEDVIDADENTVKLDIVDGRIRVITYKPGDVTSDNKINSRDLVKLSQYISDRCMTDPEGYNAVVNADACDVTGDGKINTRDLIRLSQYISDGGVTDPQGYNAVLKPALPPECVHSMEKIAANEATCTKAGNRAYWSCSKCDKYFSDENGTTELSLEETVIDAKGHSEEIIPGYAPTYEQNGLTDGIKCSECSTVLVEQNIIPKLEADKVYVEYVLDDNDAYLTQYILDSTVAGNVINPNENIIDTTEKGYSFKKIENGTIPGYEFQGWYTDTIDSAVRVETLAKGQTGSIKLYAKWIKTTYTVTFASDMVPQADIEYTTDKGKELPKPKLDKYTFVGWSDEDGNMWDKIPVGTASDLTLYANWASTRNKATAVNDLKDPIIVEDSDNGLILFTYEIGTIEKVPLFTLMNLNCVEGIITGNTRTEEISISTTRAEAVAEVISNATTNSASWTLENNWNSSTEVSQTYLDQTEQSREEAETLSKNESNSYNLSTSYGGTKTNTDTSSGSFKLSGNKAHSDTTTTESGQNFELSVDGKYTSESSLGLKLGLPIEGLDLGISAGKKNTFEIGAGADYGNYVKNTNSGTDSWSNGAEFSGEHSNSFTNEKTWNSSMGYEQSSSIGMSNTVSNAISKLISEQYGYGESYAEGGSNSQAQELASSKSSSNEFSTTMTYYTSEITSTTTSYTSTGNTKGDYRLVMSGTVHVFAVVGYDVATSSYFVYTYNVLDDKTEEYLDYSFDGSFTDYETSIIPFEVPVFVNDFVNNRLAITNGLTLDPDNGEMVKYTPSENGSKEIVSVPSYVAVDNADGTFRSVKVTSISSDLFRNNTDIVGIILGHHITEIPDNAFEGCTSLKYVICPGVTKIGSNAFKGCTSLEEFTVSSSITSLGDNAFEGVAKVNIFAYSSEVAHAAAECGANSIVLDVSEIPESDSKDITLSVESANYFELQGKDKEYKNLSLKSNASTTVINGVKIVDGKGISLELSSEELTLNRVNVSTSGYAMLLTADETNIVLNSNNNLSSTSGNTVVSKNICLSTLSSSVIGKLNISDKMLVCGQIEGADYLFCNDIEYIDQTEYEQYKKGMFSILLNANGGSVQTDSITVYVGSAIGTLPVPTRDYYAFDGWYTASEGGTQITNSSVFFSAEDVTIYAHWTLNPLSDWVTETEIPSGAQIIETQTQYRYRDRTKQTTTSTSSTLDGWTQYGSPTYGAWSAWSAWTAGYMSSNNTTDVQTGTVYGYYYYTCTNCGAHMHGYNMTCYTWLGGCGRTGTIPNNFTSVWLTTPWSSASDPHGTGKPYIDDPTYGRVYRWADGGSARAGYRVRKRDVYYSFYKWSDYGSWSSWSTNVCADSDSRQVETRTQYKYRLK